MKQVLHIFRKDVRHRWIEISVLLALLIAYAWHEIRSWAHPGSWAYGVGVSGFIGNVPGLLPVLLPIAWIIIIVRNVQDESLVGDRQFWVTRPYDWHKLLAAKLLFFFLIISVPLFLLQVFLIAKAGFPLSPHLKALLLVQLILLLILILPVSAGASLTSSIAQFFMAVLGLALYFSGLAYISSKIPNAQFDGSGLSLQMVALFATLLAVLFLQYSRRKTQTSRLLLAGFVVVAVVIVATYPYRSSINREYPALAVGQLAPMQLALSIPDKESSHDSVYPSVEEKKEVQILIPVSVSGVLPDSIIDLKGRSVALKSPNGVRWNSEWERQGDNVYSDTSGLAVRFELKRELFEQVKDSPVTLDVALAYALYRNEDSRSIVVPEGEFVLPEMGRCAAVPAYARALSCRIPLPGPDSFLAIADMSATTCPIAEDQHVAKAGTMARMWNEKGSSIDFGISPIQETDIYLNESNPSDLRSNFGMCPGTPLIISHPKFVTKAQTTVHFENIRLIDFVPRGYKAIIRER